MGNDASFIPAPQGKYLRLVELILDEPSRGALMAWPWTFPAAEADLLRVRHHVTLWYHDCCPSEGLAEAWPAGTAHAIEPVGIARGAKAEALVVRVSGRTHQRGRPDRLLHITLAFDAADNGGPANSVDLLANPHVLCAAPAVSLRGIVVGRWAEAAA
jgi:hypothetical protein